MWYEGFSAKVTCLHACLLRFEECEGWGSKGEEKRVSSMIVPRFFPSIVGREEGKERSLLNAISSEQGRRRTKLRAGNRECVTLSLKIFSFVFLFIFWSENKRFQSEERNW